MTSRCGTSWTPRRSTAPGHGRCDAALERQTLGLDRALVELPRWKPDILYAHGLQNPAVEQRALDLLPQCSSRTTTTDVYQRGQNVQEPNNHAL